MGLQLRDATFRRHFLLQCLILMQARPAPTTCRCAAAAAHSTTATCACLPGLLRNSLPPRDQPRLPMPHLALGVGGKAPHCRPCNLPLQWCERPRQKDKTGLRSKPLDDLQVRSCGLWYTCRAPVCFAPELIPTSLGCTPSGQTICRPSVLHASRFTLCVNCLQEVRVKAYAQLEATADLICCATCSTADTFVYVCLH